MKSEANSINSQEEYDKQKASSNSIKLSSEEKTELSWQFLERITEIVNNKFSAEDKQVIKAAGRALADNGATYKHQVETEVRTINDKGKINMITKNKDDGNTRSV